ncbi:MAG: putative rane protein YccC, partial [Phycisphaerales bacterium]|nr:putative rane protein YccC [Phycisphaerales bacterium]
MFRPALATLARWFDAAAQSPDVGRACRSVAALMVPLLMAAGGLLGPGTSIPLEVTFVALAAQSLAGVDIRGPYPLRLGFLLAMVTVMTGSTALGSAVGPHPWAAAVAVGLVALSAGALRHLTPEYGPMLAAPVGLTFLIAANVPAAHGSHAMAVLAGAAWAVVVQVALWPVRAQHPLRRAVGDAWRAAAELFDAMATAGLPGGPGTGDDPADDAKPEADSPKCIDADGRPEAVATAGGALRTALESAYATLEAVGTARPMWAQLDAAVHAAGRLGFRAAGLGTALEGLAGRPDFPALNAPFAAAMEALASTARAIGLAVVSRQPAHLAACEVRLQRAATLLAALREAVVAVPVGGEDAPAPGADGLSSPQGPSPAARQAAAIIDLVDDQLADSLLSLVALTDRAGERAVFPLELFDTSTWRLRPLAAALNLSPKPDPALVRFTARLAVLMTLGVLAVKLFPEFVPGHPLTHGYWLPFTILVVSQTDYGATRKRAAERLLGTLVGSVLGSVLLMLHPPRPWLFAGAGVAGFLFAFYLRRQYRVAIVFVTILVVVLTEMNHPVTVEL